MRFASTEGALRDWRHGSTQAERLCAALLHLESFQDVDPQHPLGGPDGLKDVRCNRNGQAWIAAAYFPPTPPSFQEIQEKFEHDFAGVAANGAQGFAFFVNQPLTIGERQSLQAASGITTVEIYHLEIARLARFCAPQKLRPSPQDDGNAEFEFFRFFFVCQHRSSPNLGFVEC